MSDQAEKRRVAYGATPGFFADAMLGSLARWMRALGYDVAYENSIDDKVLVERAEAEGRVILTRDLLLIERRKAVSRSFFIRGNDLWGQLRQVTEAFPADERLFLSRCLRCNLRLEDIEKSLVKGRVAPYVYETNERFSLCAGCGRIYWAGTHALRMAEAIKKLLEA